MTVANGIYYWQIRDAELDPTGMPINVVTFARSAEAAIVCAVKMANLLKKTLPVPACILPTARVAEILEHHLCTTPSTKIGAGETFVMFHVLSGMEGVVRVSSDAGSRRRRPRGVRD